MSSAPPPDANGFVILLEMFAHTILSMSPPAPQPQARTPMPVVDDPKFRASIARVDELLEGSEIANAASVLPSCLALANHIWRLQYNDSWVERMTAAGCATSAAYLMDECARNPACARVWDGISSRACGELGVPRDVWDQAWKALAERGAQAPVAP